MAFKFPTKEEMGQRRQANRRFLQTIFGVLDPTMEDKCSRCGVRFGDHYGTSFETFCPDQWVAAGHQLSVI